MSKRWHYIGDVNLEHGGVFIQEGDYPDYCNAVRVTPCSDAGGPENWYRIESGTVYMGDAQHMVSALECCDESADAPQWRKGYAMMCYMAMDVGRVTNSGCYAGPDTIVQIGAKRGDYDSWRWDDEREPDYVLRGNTSLRRYVKREFMA